MNSVHTIYLADGQIKESMTGPQRKGGIWNYQDRHVHPVRGLDNYWKEEGYVSKPPALGDRVALTSWETVPITDPRYLPSLMRPEVFLISTDLGFIWVHQLFGLPVWSEALPI